MAPAPSPECASRCPRATASCSSFACDTRAGISPASTSSIRDPHTGEAVAALYPLDKRRNAEHPRRALAPVTDAGGDADIRTTTNEAAPLLKRLMADYAATGMPPAYIPFDDRDTRDDDDEDNTP